ncbi:hypothetical protein LXL04_029915 [Taraxacum kok-saghyz]
MNLLLVTTEEKVQVMHRKIKKLEFVTQILDKVVINENSKLVVNNLGEMELNNNLVRQSLEALKPIKKKMSKNL